MSAANLIQQIKSDKKKASALGGLLLAGLLLWSRMVFQDVPHTADAQPLADAAMAAAASASAANNLVSGTLRSVAVNLHGTVDRNIFAVNPAFMAQTNVTAENTPTQAKSSPDPADSKRDREAIVAEAQHLNLQSTLLGQRPRAVINGQLLAPGQKILGFEVLEVQPRQVTVRKNQVLIALKMFQP